MTGFWNAMSFLDLKQLFLGSDLPWLPEAVASQWAMHAAWAVVLGTAVLWLGRRRMSLSPWVFVALVMLWNLLPGPVSPAYWLGLAFQSPSLMTALLCLGWLVQQWRWRTRQASPAVGRASANASAVPSQTKQAAWQVSGLAGIVLGWVLLLDMLAWWPVSLYAWGFSPAALAMACAAVVMVWLVWGGGKDGQQLVALLAGVLLLFAVLRLPSGNVWDTLLDPGLWIVLQAIYLRRGFFWARQQITLRRAKEATRA